MYFVDDWLKHEISYRFTLLIWWARQNSSRPEMKNLWQSCFIISEIVPFYPRFFFTKSDLIFASKTHNFFPFQAIYNVLVSALFCILAWAVYYVVLIVLEPFLVPLFWAVLTGFVIHPYKTRLSEFLRQWICSLENKNEPAFLAISGDLLRTLYWNFWSCFLEWNWSDRLYQ